MADHQQFSCVCFSLLIKEYLYVMYPLSKTSYIKFIYLVLTAQLDSRKNHSASFLFTTFYWYVYFLINNARIIIRANISDG